MVKPTKGTVNDTKVGSATGAVNTHVPLYFPLETRSDTTATLGWQTQLVDGVLRVEHVEMCEILPKSQEQGVEEHHPCPVFIYRPGLAVLLLTQEEEEGG